MTPVFADTGYFLALINEGDEHHQEAEQLEPAVAGRRLIVTDAVLLELGSVLARRFRREAAVLIAHLLTSPDVQVVRLTPPLLDRSIALFEQSYDKTWSLVDCVSFVVMRRFGVSEALGFDKHFEQAGFTIIRAR